MSSPAEKVDYKEPMLQEYLDLRARLVELPPYLRGRVLPLCEKVGHFICLQSKLINIAQDAVDDLQLEVRYLQFDLDATQREKALLLEMDDDLEE
jgi:hypothetical protein